MALPGALLPWVELRFTKLDADGNFVPNAGGFVEFRETDLTTPQDTFSDSDLTVPNQNPVELGDDGRPPSPIYLLPSGYSVYVSDSDSVPLYDIPFVEDVGSAYLSQLGTIQAQGTTAVSSPYTVDPNDNLVIVDSATTPFVVQLPAASERGTPLVVKNISNAITVRVTPDGTDTIEGISAYYTVPASVSPMMPTLTLISDGISAWWITGALGIV